MTPTQQPAALSSKPHRRPGDPASYAVTHNDLLVLARHHARTVLDRLVDFFFTGQTGGSERRERWAAEAELAKLQEVLGEEVIAEVQAEAESDVRRQIGRTHWHLFLNGTQEDRDRVIDDVYGRIAYTDEKLADRAAKERALTALRANPSEVFRDDASDMWSLAEPEPDDEDPRLVLVLTTLRAGKVFLSESRVERPAGWFDPYGLGQR
jgi:hypothetical protein